MGAVSTGFQRWRLPQPISPDSGVSALWAADGALTAEPIADAESLPGRYSTAGRVGDEVERFVGYGIDAPTAVGSAIWDARRFLGAPDLIPGAPADVVTFDRDPRRDPSVLREPVAVLLGGIRVR